MMGIHNDGDTDRDRYTDTDFVRCRYGDIHIDISVDP